MGKSSTSSTRFAISSLTTSVRSIMRHAPRPLVAALLLSSVGLTSPVIAQQEQPPADLSGRWAQLVVTTSVSKLPIAGKVITSTKSFALLDIAQDAKGQLTSTEQVCNIDIISDSDSIRTIIPPKFLKDVSGKSRPIHRAKIDGKDTIVLPKITNIFGAKLSAKDKLPTDEDDPRVIDADKDGKPGLTVKVNGMIDGELYIVTRGTNELKGHLMPSGRVEGHVTWNSEQVVLDATSIFLEIEPTTWPDKRPTKNFFRWYKVPAATDCAELTKRWKEWLR